MCVGVSDIRERKEEWGVVENSMTWYNQIKNSKNFFMVTKSLNSLKKIQNFPNISRTYP